MRKVWALRRRGGVAATSGALLAFVASTAVAATAEDYTRALRAAGIPSTAAAVVVRPLDGGALRLSENADRAMNPASTMKLVTSYVALRALGPAYTWRTDAYAVGTRDGEVLRGDLVLRGSGDPSLVIERLWLFVQQLRGAGLRELRGDVLLDRSAYVLPPHDPAEFDGDELRAYNVGPDALLVNFKSVAYSFVPQAGTQIVHVALMPPLAGARAPRTVRAAEGACGDWHNKLRADFSRPLEPVFRGAFPLSCGERSWYLSPIEPDPYFEAVFRAMWQASGGTWSGRVRPGAAPLNTPAGGNIVASSAPVVSFESVPLAEVVRDLNKFSNNVMTQQVFLTIGAEALGWPASFERSREAVRGWLVKNALALPELVLDNGSGLSRVERISAGGMALLLADAYASPVMPEFMAALPLSGVDGTMKRRKGAIGAAHVKTGMLDGVSAIAGYVLAESGRRYAVVAIVNHANAAGAQRAHDALLEWVRARG